MILDPCSEEGSDEYPDDYDSNVQITWFDEGVVLVFEYNLVEIRFGMVATAGESALSWTGEDCLTGATSSDGKPIDACHNLVDDGSGVGHASFSLYGGADPDTIDPENQTVFTRDDRNDLTYFLGYGEGDDAGCVIAGDNWCYYETLGCQVWQGIISDY